MKLTRYSTGPGVSYHDVCLCRRNGMFVVNSVDREEVGGWAG